MKRKTKKKRVQEEDGATDGVCLSIFSRTAALDWASAKADLFSV